jgi:hypothetical protein
MASVLQVEELRGPSSGANANKVIIPSGQTLEIAGSASGLLTEMPSGSVIQVKTAYMPRASSVSVNTNYSVDIGLNVTITPSSATSTFLVMIDFSIDALGDSHFDAQLYRRENAADTAIGSGEAFQDAANFGGSNQHGHGYAYSFLDTPSTTNELTYKFLMKDGGANNIIAHHTGASNMTVMEIAG